MKRRSFLKLTGGALGALAIFPAILKPKPVEPECDEITGELSISPMDSGYLEMKLTQRDVSDQIRNLYPGPSSLLSLMGQKKALL